MAPDVHHVGVEAVDTSAAAGWGRYYDGDPRVVAADIADVRAACAAQLAPLAGHAWLDGAGWARGVRAA